MKTIESIKEKFSDKIINHVSFAGQDFLTAKKECLKEMAVYLRDELHFDFLSDITCVDYKGYPGKENTPRFETVYHFYSHKTKERISLKFQIEESSPNIDSLTGFWLAANWYEREIYDMYGIHFIGHPDLRRILMYEEFKGHPLRKDYPLKARQPRIPHED